MAGTKPKKAKADSNLRDLTAKAQRRGKKLQRTLTQIVAQTELDQGHPAHVLLKALEKNLSKLRHHGEAHERPDGVKGAKKAKAVKAEKPAAPTHSSSAAKAPRPARSPRAKKDVSVVTEEPPASKVVVP